MNNKTNHSLGKKLLSMLLVLIMVVSVLPLSIFADEASTVSTETNAAWEGKPEDGKTTGKPFIAGQTGGSDSNSFRIPAMVTLDDGTIVAAADARWENAHDGGGNDTIVCYSKDNGATWNYTFANYMGDNNHTWDNTSTTFIDPSLATDGKNVYMMVDLFVNGRSNSTRDGKYTHSTGSGFDSNGNLKLAKGTSTSYTYYLKDGKIYDSSNNEVSGYSVDAYFNITGTDGTNTNLFYADSPYQVYPTIYNYITKSEDGGATWSEPILLNYNSSTEYGCLVGVGHGVVTSKGTIILPFYRYQSGWSTSSSKLGFIYSTDGGLTWSREDGITGGSESTVVELSDGTLRVFYRTSGSGVHYVDVEEVSKGNFTWGSGKTISVSSNSNCNFSAIKYSKTINEKEVIIVSCPTSNRTTGYLYLFDAEAMTTISSYKVNSGNFQYSALTELNDGSISLLYETHNDSAYVNGVIEYANYSPESIFNVTFDKSNIITDEETGISVEFTNKDVADMTISSATVEGIDNYIAYNITPDLNYDKTTATVTLPLGSLKDTAEARLYGFYVEDGKINKVSGIKNDDGTYTFTIPHFSVVGVAEISNSTVSDVETITVTEGSTTTIEVDLDYDASLKDGSYSDEYANVVWTIEKDAGTEASLKKVTAPESGGKYYIGDGTNFIKVTKSGNYYKIGTTTDPSEATEWTFTKSSNYLSSYTINASIDGTTVYLSHSDSSPSVSTSSDNSWYIGTDGIPCYYGWRTTYYLVYSDGWKISNSSSNGACAYTYVKGTPSWAKATIKVSGKTVGETETFMVGNKTFKVVVNSRPEGYIGSVSLEVGKSTTIDLPNSLRDGETITWKIDNTTYAGMSGNNTGATLYGREEGTATLTAIVRDEKGNITSTYIWSVEVTEGTKPNAGTGSVTYTLNNTVYNGKIYYSISGGPLIEAPYTETIDANGNTVRVYEELVIKDANVAWSMVNLFVAPDEGYALTQIASTSSSNCRFFPIDKDNLTADYESNTGTSTSNQNNLENCLSDAQRETMISEAISKNCDAVFWYSRSNKNSTPLTSANKVTATHTVYCDKLPTIDKEVDCILDTSGNKVTDSYGNVITEAKNIIADAGYKVVFKITVTGYREHAGITFKNAQLNDIMSGITLYSDAGLTKKVDNPLDITSILDKDRTGITSSEEYTYYAVYTITSDDLKSGKTLENRVELTYEYDSQFSSGAYGSAADANASFKLTDFPVINDIVIDFGLPVTILNGIKWAETYNGTITVTEATAKFGTVTVEGNNKVGLTIIYTPNKIFTDIDVVTLVSSRGNSSTFRVIPASTVYYEDDTSFVKTTAGAGSASGATWTTDGTTTSANQALEELGEAKNIYGYDEAYNNCNTFSMGSAMKVTVTAAMNNSWTDGSAWPTATFTFKGTGFDVVSLTDNNSGLITYDVVNSKGETVESRFVTNYYGHKYENGAWTETNDENALYQIPVIKIDDLAYDTYTVTITVAYGSFFDETGDNQYSFWLDAVRVYNPLGDTADETYAEDGEGWPQFIELHDELVKENESTYNAVLIEGKTDATLTEYTAYGPNHEVYLAPNQSIAFKLSSSDSTNPVIDKIASVSIGVKAVDGTATYKINSGEAMTVSTATDMYYDITSVAKSGIVTITNTGSTILSLTTVKVTFSENPGKKDSVTLSMTEEEVNAAVYAVRAMFAPVVETFEPERFDANWKSGTVYAGQKAILTVKTSEDVEAVIVNGEVIDTYRTRTVRTGRGSSATTVTYREFTYSTVASESADYVISAVNADGIESETITASLTVKQSAQLSDIRNWINNIISRWF